MSERTAIDWTTRSHGMAYAQLGAYVGLIAASALDLLFPAFGSSITAAATLVTLVAFIVFWPFRGTAIDRAACAAFGLVALAFASTNVGLGIFGKHTIAKQNGAQYTYQVCDAWALAAGGLLVALVVLAFGRQMARKNRSHLIRSLSHAVTAGVASIALTGWCFLPDVLMLLRDHTGEALVGLTVIAILAAALAAASVLWTRDADPDPAIAKPWVGTGLLPVMLMGVTIAVVALVLAHRIG